MINYYFYNSYTGSPTGFQLTYFNREKNCLELLKENVDKKVESCLTSSGIKCAILKNSANENTFIARKIISANSTENINWYINLVITASDILEKGFVETIVTYFIDNENFTRKLSGFFKRTPNNELSFDVDIAAFDEYLSSIICKFEPIGYNNEKVKKYNEMLMELQNTSDIDELYMIVTEATLKYFFKQQPIFATSKPKYVFSLNDYESLINGNFELLDENPEEEKSANTKEQNEQAFSNKTIKDNKELAIAVAVGATAIVGLTVYAIWHNLRNL